MNTTTNSLPDLSQSILKNENIGFKVQSKLTIEKSLIQKIFGFILLVSLLIEAVIFYKYRIDQQEVYLIGIIIAFGIILTSTILIAAAGKLSNTINKINIAPWFIATDNFLLVVHNSHSLPIPWKYFSQNVTIKQTGTNAGNISLKYDRKEFSKGIEGHFKNFASSGTIYMYQVNNPVLIGEICRTNIRQNGGPQ